MVPPPVGNDSTLIMSIPIDDIIAMEMVIEVNLTLLLVLATLYVKVIRNINYSICCVVSFIGVSRSLPMTAYIKMVDIWMIITMMYTFSVVTLYSVMEFMKDDINTPINLKQKKKYSRKNKTIIAITFMLDFGLPILVIIFILFFYVWHHKYFKTGIKQILLNLYMFLTTFV